MIQRIDLRGTEISQLLELCEQSDREKGNLRWPSGAWLR